MKILVVDDEIIALEGLVRQVRNAAPKALIGGFRHTDEALLFAQVNRPEVAFLDIEMRDMDGIRLAQRLQEQLPDINLIFTTGHEEYMGQAFKLHASGYLLKPITDDMVSEELSKLRKPVSVENSFRVSVRTSGEFEVFIDRRPVHFKYTKSKEMFAYLIYREGSFCSLAEISRAFWGDEAKKHLSYVTALRADMLGTFGKEGCDDIFCRQRGAIGIQPDKFYCDYYDRRKAERKKKAAPEEGAEGELQEYESVLPYEWAARKAEAQKEDGES